MKSSVMCQLHQLDMSLRNIRVDEIFVHKLYSFEEVNGQFSIPVHFLGSLNTKLEMKDCANFACYFFGVCVALNSSKQQSVVVK